MTYHFHILLIVCVVILCSCGFMVTIVSLQYHERQELRALIDSSVVEDRLSGIFSTLNDFPGSASKDMLFLRSLSSISELFDTNAFSRGAWRAAHEDIQQFIDRNSAYAGIAVYLDTLGCVVLIGKVRDDAGNVSCNPPEGILNDMFDVLPTLPAGTVHVFPLTTFSHSTKLTTSPIPALLYGTALSAPGSAKGGVVGVVDANYFLEEIRRLKREGETVYLLNADGSYLAHPDSHKEKLSGGTANFYQDYPSIPSGVLMDTEHRHLETDDAAFTFLRITPAISNFVLYNPGDITQEGKGNHYWVLAAVSEKYLASNWFVESSYAISIIVLLVVHATLLACAYLILAPTRKFAP